MKKSSLSLLIIFVFAAVSATAQTSSFTYQGKLTDGGTAANGQYDLSFKLFASNGAQIGSDVTVEDVQVTVGIFTVNLNFGASPFTSNAATLLEIAVRPGAGTGVYTTLAPRQAITSSPYSVQTIRAASAALADNANQLGGLNASEYVQTNDSRLSDDRNPLPNSPNYIQNIPGIGQQTASFNISGGGTANIFNAATQFNIGGNRVVSVAGANNFIAGVGAGQVNTGTENSFVGSDAGRSNTTGLSNSFFGHSAGRSNITAAFNAFFGGGAGFANTNGSENAFFGQSAGQNNSIGSSNAFFGRFAGSVNATGSGNVFIGYNANPTSNNLSNATAIGSYAAVSQSNSLVLGGIGGVNGATLSTNVGIGTTAPEQKLHVVGNEILSSGTQAGFKFRDRGSTSSNDDWVWYSDTNIARFFRAGTGDLLTVQTNGNVGMGVPVPTFKLHVSDSSNTGLRVQTNTAGGTVASFGGNGAFQIDATGVPGGRLKITETGKVYLPRLAEALVLRAADGGCWIINIANNGLLATYPTPCP